MNHPDPVTQTRTIGGPRTLLELDFSPEYAREMGPKIAEMLGERKAAS